MQPNTNNRPTRTPTKRPSVRKATSRTAVQPAHKSPLITVILISAVWLVLVVVLASLGRYGTPVVSNNSAPYIYPYNWAGLQRNGDHLAYYEDNQLRSRTGIDVSSHQEDIDWQAVASDGIDFAMVRAGNRGYTEGALYADERFSENIDGAQAAGLDAGVYFFSQAITPDEAREEADLVLSLLNGRDLQMPVAFDHEPVSDSTGRANHMSGEDLAACVRAFCEHIEKAGYDTIVYGNKQDIARFGGDTLDNRSVWLAEYDVKKPTAQFAFTMWQYTNNGSVAGISAGVDMNILFTVE